MAIAVGSEMASNACFEYQVGAPGTSPQTFSFTNAAGTFLVLGVTIGGPGARTITLGTVSYGGNAMTKLLEDTTNSNGTGGKIALYYLQSPPTGANTVSIAWTDNLSAAENLRLNAGCISFTGVHASSPFTQQTSLGSDGSAGTTVSANLTGVTKLSLGLLGHGATFASNTQTLSCQGEIDDASALGNLTITRSTSTGSVTHSATADGSDSFAAIMVELAEAGSGNTYEKTGLGTIGP